MGRYLTIAKRVIEQSGQKAPTVTSVSTSAKLPVSDPYAERMRAALRQINPSDYPARMVPWLDTVRPDLYVELTSRLPDEIHRLWSERAPLEGFEAALTRLVSLHRECCDLYRAVRKKEKSVPKPSQMDSGTPQSNRGAE